MDVKEYINSGIVELYAMDTLSPEEKREFERLMILYPEIISELNKVEDVLEEYIFAQAVNPRPQLREKILDKIKGATVYKIKEGGKVLPENSHTVTYKYMIAASLAALVVCTFSSWFFYNRWNEAEERYTLLLNEKNDLAQNYNFVKLTYDDALASMQVMRDQDSKIITLSSTDTSQNYLARIYWNNSNHSSYIDVVSLPEPEEGKQYQLWALVGGKPVDAGVFFTGDAGIQRVKDILKADAWAVTLEPKGGSISPTLDQMYLLSKS
jgi:anti-sigma-K factor RskA